MYVTHSTDLATLQHPYFSPDFIFCVIPSDTSPSLPYVSLLVSSFLCSNSNNSLKYSFHLFFISSLSVTRVPSLLSAPRFNLCSHLSFSKMPSYSQSNSFAAPSHTTLKLLCLSHNIFCFLTCPLVVFPCSLTRSSHPVPYFTVLSSFSQLSLLPRSTNLLPSSALSFYSYLSLFLQRPCMMLSLNHAFTTPSSLLWATCVNLVPNSLWDFTLTPFSISLFSLSFRLVDSSGFLCFLSFKFSFISTR